ncbi:MAG: hypothetical protein ACLU42_12575 [Roseburia faecis]|uniref:hypothetical protein n=1 Tax=Roseburia faecis TaxID=301302 RepID=UPI003A11F00D
MEKKRVVAVLLTLLVLLQFPADFGSVAYAAQKNEIRGTISVASKYLPAGYAAVPGWV